MMRRATGPLAICLAVLLLFAAGAAPAEEGPRLLTAPESSWSERDASLQRGVRNFVNYCLNCHSAQYMRYARLTDLGLTEALIKDNLMFPTDKIGSTMTVAMTRSDAASWFGAAPPDLTVEARVRGKDWLYSYLLAFYRDEKSPTGWKTFSLASDSVYADRLPHADENSCNSVRGAGHDRRELVVLGLACRPAPARGAGDDRHPGHP